MIKFLISWFILIIATHVTIAHCKHKNREIFYPVPHNEHRIDDIPIEINRHPHGVINHNDPDFHVSVEYNNGGKLDLDGNDHVAIHKITKKDLPEWLDENHDLNWNNGNHHTNWDRNAGAGKNNRNHHNHNVHHKKPETHWDIKRDDSDDWRGKKEVVKWNIKDVERRVWEDDGHPVNWNNKGVDYDKWNNNNNGQDLIYKDKKDLSLWAPEIVLDKSGDKNALVELNDDLYDLVVNTTKTGLDNIHNLQTDLLNVKLDLKPLITLQAKEHLGGGFNINDRNIWNNNNKRVDVVKHKDIQDLVVDKHINIEKQDYIVDLERKPNRNHEKHHDNTHDYQRWLNKQHKIKLDEDNSNSNWGVINDRVFKVQDQEHEIDWNNKKNNHKRWNIDVRVPEWDDGKRKLKRRNHHNWKYANNDDVVDGSEDGANPSA